MGRPGARYVFIYGIVVALTLVPCFHGADETPGPSTRKRKCRPSSCSDLESTEMSGLNSAMEDLSSDDEDEPYTRPPRRHATRTRRDHAAVAGDTQPPPDAGPSLAGPPTAAADEPGDTQPPPDAGPSLAGPPTAAADEPGDTQPPPDAVEDPGEGPNLDDVESYVFDFNMDEYNPVVQLLLGSIGDPGEVMQAFRGGRRRQTLSQVMCKADKENFQM